MKTRAPNMRRVLVTGSSPAQLDAVRLTELADVCLKKPLRLDEVVAIIDAPSGR